MYLGIDVHKRYAQVAVMDEAGEIVEEGRAGLIHYCHLCVPFVDIDSEGHGLFTRDASA